MRQPGKGNSNSHGARPVHLIITMIKSIRSKLSITKSLSLPEAEGSEIVGHSIFREGFRGGVSGFRVQGSGLGFKIQGSGFRVQGSGFKVQGTGFRVQG